MHLLKGIHHIAVICSDYSRSKAFYTEVLGFRIEREIFREARKSYKLDLSLNGTYTIELFSFPEVPPRVSQPEAAGLRHLAFAVGDLDQVIDLLHRKQIITEPVRVDEWTQKRFTFISDPDGLPIELYESGT
jgi:glyoxylase I family protein